VRRIRIGVLLAAASISLLAPPAQAQTAPEYNLPEVVVTTDEAAAAKSSPKKKTNSTAAPASTAPAASATAHAGAGSPTNTAAAASEGVSSGRAQSDRIVEQVTTVDQVTAEQIERSGARTLDEAIRLMPGVFVLNGGDGVPRIDIRGFRTRHVTLLIDGVPYNGSVDGQFDPRSIPVENIARIKVTRGGGSVLYGPGGNAAVIDIVTKSAGPGLHGTASGRVGIGKGQDGSITASYGSSAVRSFVSASLYNQDSFHLSDDFSHTTLQPTDERTNSNREDRAFYANSEWTPSDFVKWGISVNYRNGEYGKPPTVYGPLGTTGGCTYAPCSTFASGTRFERVDNYDSVSLQTSGLIKLGGGLSVRPIAYYNELNELTNRYDDPKYSTQIVQGSFTEDAQSSIFGGGLQIMQKLGSSLLTISADSHRESWDADGFSVERIQVTGNTNQRKAACDALHGTIVAGGGGGGGGGGNSANCDYAAAIGEDRNIDVRSAAAEYEIKLLPALSGVFGAGWAEQSRSEGTEGGYTYLAGLRYDITSTTAVRGSAARKIRFPTISDYYSVDSGNPDLKTEVTHNYEVALEQNLPTVNTFLSVALFRINAENFISMNRTAQVFENKDLLRFQGVETTATFRPVQNLGLQVGYTYLDSRNLAPVAGGTTAVQYEPKHTVTFSTDYHFVTGTTVSADYQFVADSVAISRDQLATLALDPYHLLGVGFTQDFDGGAAQLFGRVDNILDEDYQTSYGFPEPGRTFFVGLRSRL
jgi:vitamin B12 transporter